MSDFAIYADYGCPFAHRVLAFAHELGLEPTVHLARIGGKPEGVGAHSVSKRIPLVVHGDLVLTESRVILEYLADVFAYEPGLPSTATARATHRLAIELVDAFLTPHLTAPLEERQKRRFDEVLGVFEAAITEQERPSLFELQIAPIWQRLVWMADDPTVEKRVRARGPLAEWLDAAAAKECIRTTSTDPQTVRAEFERAKSLGLVDHDPFARNPVG